ALDAARPGAALADQGQPNHRLWRKVWRTRRAEPGARSERAANAGSRIGSVSSICPDRRGPDRGGRVTQEGERDQGSPGATPTAPGLMTFGSPSAGEVFAERYGLEAHVDTDAAGREVWRGIGGLLARR